MSLSELIIGVGIFRQMLDSLAEELGGGGLLALVRLGLENS